MDTVNYNMEQLEGISEIIGIGLKSSSETLAKLINKDVSFETEKSLFDKIKNIDEFGLMPGVIVEIKFSGCITGTAAILIQSMYIQNVLNILMNIDEDEDSSQDFELDEISMGTFRELINQMMSSFSSALTNFFGSNVESITVDIKKLESINVLAESFKYSTNDTVITTPVKFVIKDVVSGIFNLEFNMESSESIIGMINMIPENEDENMILDAIKGGMNLDDIKSNKQSKNDEQDAYDNSAVEVQSCKFPSFDDKNNDGYGMPIANGNIDLLMDVPLNVTVEIGKTKKKMREIMDFTQGTIIDLEKQAGAPVDVVVNGQLIARGDVVVIDDNFGIRITEIVGNKDFLEKN